MSESIFRQETYTQGGKTVLMLSEITETGIPETRFVSGTMISKTDPMGRTMQKVIPVKIDAASIAEAFEKLDKACDIAARQFMLLDNAAGATMPNGKAVFVG